MGYYQRVNNIKVLLSVPKGHGIKMDLKVFIEE